MNTAVALIPKPATKHLQQLPTCTDEQEVHPRVLSFSMLPVPKCLIPYLENLGGSLRSCAAKIPLLLCLYPAWLIGGVDCLCADNFKHPQSSLETQPPSEATILCCRVWTIPPSLLVTKGKSSQGRDKWVFVIPWDSLKVRHRPVPQQPKHICLERTKGEPKIWAWPYFLYRAVSAQLLFTLETCLLLVLPHFLIDLDPSHRYSHFQLILFVYSWQKALCGWNKEHWISSCV